MPPKKGSKELKEQAAKARAASAAQRLPSQADEPAATATPAPATVTQEAAAAEPLEAADDMADEEAADDMADERNAAAPTGEGAPEASATSTTSGPLPLDLAEEEETRAAWEREMARVEAVLDARDARDASSQVGFAPLDPEDAMAIRILARDQRMDKGEEEEEKEYKAKWQAAWEEERERRVSKCPYLRAAAASYQTGSSSSSAAIRIPPGLRELGGGAQSFT